MATNSLSKNLYIYEKDHLVRTGLLKYYDPLLMSNLYTTSLSALNWRNDTLPTSASSLYPSGVNARSFDLIIGGNGLSGSQSNNIYMYKDDQIVRTGLLKYYDPLLLSTLYNQSLATLNIRDDTLPSSASSLYPNGINSHLFNLIINE